SSGNALKFHVVCVRPSVWQHQRDGARIGDSRSPVLSDFGWQIDGDGRRKNPKGGATYDRENHPGTKSMSKKYFVMRGEKPEGAFGLGELAHFREVGVLKPDDLCAREGDSEWKPASSVLPPRKKRTPGLQVAGVILCVIGGLAALYFFCMFDVSVSTQAGRVA